MKMMVLVVGGSGSGKSAYAEEKAVGLAQADMNKYYLATMRIFDEEGREKVEKHRNLRSGKGFFTIEQPTEIGCAPEKMKAGDRTVLLECISNLTANEMFSEGSARMRTQVTENVMRGLKLLKEQTTHLVVVSNNVFEDGVSYDETTAGYIQTMGKINRELAAMADQVVEVTAGIPVVIK